MSREHAYAYEAGYRDGSINYELEHFPACKNVADLQEALEENAKLRQQLADVTESMGRVEERCAKLREYVERKRHLQDFARLVNENAALRELVRELYEIAQPEAPSMFEAEFTDRMRELGVEVDG